MHVYTVLYRSAENEVSIDFWRQEGSKFEDVLNRGLYEAALSYFIIDLEILSQYLYVSTFVPIFGSTQQDLHC